MGLINHDRCYRGRSRIGIRLIFHSIIAELLVGFRPRVEE